MEKRHSLDVLFPLGVLAVFALAAVWALLLAAGGYRDSLNRADRDFGRTAALAYVTEKLRSGDESDSVRVTELVGCPALVFSVSREGSLYDTYIYCYEGSLRELMVKRELSPTPEMGRALLELEEFRPEWVSEGLLKLECRGAGETDTRYVNLKAGEEYPCG